MRALWIMARARRELEGEAVATLLRIMPVALLEPERLRGMELNPFKEPPVESELMKAHKAKLAEMRWKAETGGA